MRHFLSGFPWLLLGYSQYQNLKLIQISSIFGVYIISGLIILINIGLSELLVKRRRISVFVSFLLLIVVFAYGYYREKESGFDKSRPYICDTDASVQSPARVENAAGIVGIGQRGAHVLLAVAIIHGQNVAASYLQRNRIADVPRLIELVDGNDVVVVPGVSVIVGKYAPDAVGIAAMAVNAQDRA